MIRAPTPLGGFEDPAQSGAVLRLVDRASPADSTSRIFLDASGWQARGLPRGSNGYKYKYKDDQAEPEVRCKVRLKKDGSVRAQCRGELTELETPFGGAAAVSLSIPSDDLPARRYCAELPGDGGNEKHLKHSDAAAPIVCQAVEAQTALGTLRGSMHGDVQAYLGVPFAEAPVGNLRFKPPVASGSWTGTRDALTFGPACPQSVGDDQTLYLDQSEDCLSLNVWTPAADDGARPV